MHSLSLNPNRNNLNDSMELAEKILDVVPKTMCELRASTFSFTGQKLPLPQFRVLAYVWKGPKTNKQLAEEIGLSISAMSRVISNLENNGWVKKHENSEDRRFSNIVITPEGERFFKKIKIHTSKFISERIMQLTEKQKTELHKGLNIIEELFKCPL